MYIIYIYHIWDEVWPASHIYVGLYIYNISLYIYELYMFYIYYIHMRCLCPNFVFLLRCCVFAKPLYEKGRLG